MNGCTDRNENEISSQPYSPLLERIHKLEEHQNRQIDHNIKISKRIDNIYEYLDDKFKFIEIKWLELDDSLKNESIMRKDLRDYCFDRLGSAISPPSENIDVYSRINELELLTNALRDKYNSMCPPSLRKEPFKCPVCEGKTYCAKSNFQDGGYITFDCKSCEGKGVIWG